MASNATQPALTEEQRRERKNQADRERRARQKADGTAQGDAQEAVAAVAENDKVVNPVNQARNPTLGQLAQEQAAQREADRLYKEEILKVFKSIDTQLSGVVNALQGIATVIEGLPLFQQDDELVEVTQTQETVAVESETVEVVAPVGTSKMVDASLVTKEADPRQTSFHTKNGVYSGSEVYAADLETVKGGRVIEGRAAGIDLEAGTVRVIAVPNNNEFAIPMDQVFLKNAPGFRSAKAYVAQQGLILAKEEEDAETAAVEVPEGAVEASDAEEAEEIEEEEDEDADPSVPSIDDFILDEDGWFKITKVSATAFWAKHNKNGQKFKFEGRAQFIRRSKQGTPLWRMVDE